MIRIGIDLGGTKIEAVALDMRGTIMARQRIVTPRDYRATVDAIAALVGALEREVGTGATVGVGIPGAVTAQGVVKNANSTWLNGHPLTADLSSRLARDVRLANDANCFAISEAVDGAAAGAEVVFGVILGTGVGGGVVVHGRILEGPNRIAGEWGHNQLPWMTDEERPGPACYCGLYGCIETFLSGPGFEREARERTGVARTGREIVAAAARGDPGAREAIARYDGRLARALAGVINILDPDVIVLGGGMSNLPELAERAQARLAHHVFSAHVATRVVCNRHGDSSGVRGAAWLWPG